MRMLRDVERTAPPAPSAPGCPALTKAGSWAHQTPDSNLCLGLGTIFQSSAFFEIFRRGRTQRKVQGEPENLRVTDEPDPEENRDRDHDRQGDGSVLDSKNKALQRPRSKRCERGKRISDCRVRQEIAALPNEEVPASRASDRAVEVT